ncbi:UNVERIFIED_CONTAM: hypothetical protein Sangu_1325300 [Sesamum angustifolium]|uniref:Uncharacterized protein n=1 Tax=Sesamum angustifolium TaxID=2727405 RepID=A0AAW2NP15_9LAMI
MAEDGVPIKMVPPAGDEKTIPPTADNLFLSETMKKYFMAYYLLREVFWNALLWAFKMFVLGTCCP